MSTEERIPWREIPLLRLLLPFGIGIFAGYHLLPPIGPIYLMIGLILVMLPLLLWGRRPLQLRQNLSWGALTSGWLLLLGVFLVQQEYELEQPSHFSHQENYEEGIPLLWVGEVTQFRASTDRLRIQLQVKALATDAESPQQACSGSLLVYLPADSLSKDLRPGYCLAFQAAATRIASPLNPDAFDFSEWQARKRVYHQTRLEPQAWQVIATDVSLRGQAYHFRERLLSILREYLPTGSNELAVGAALILGKRDELSADLRNAYAETGAVHVLAVSGLHLGFVAWGLGLLFGWGPFRKPAWRWLRLLLILAGIWIFALVTGLSPSVQRAATMFSFLWLGQTLGRRASVYNSLGASAFLLLLIDPYLLFDIGFQLSYLALLGIVFFQPRLYRLWYSPYRLVNYAWGLMTVAIAAQLTTFPLSLYYFHQFPLYFLLSGLVVVLAASLILGLGIALFLLHWSPLAGIIGYLLHGVIWLNNAFIFRLQQLPGHLLDGIWINETLLVCLFTCLLCLGCYLVYRRMAYLIAMISALALALLVNFTGQLELSEQRAWVVYHLYKASVIDALDGYHYYSISSITQEDPALNWVVNPHRDKRNVGLWPVQEPANHWYSNPPIYGFYDQQMAIINRDWSPDAVPDQPLAVNILVIEDSPRLTLASLLPYFDVDHWVIDGSNYPGQVEKWLQEAEELGISIHWTARDGAFRQEF